MATELLFRNDAYIKEFTAEVLKCEQVKDGFQITLDRTAFYTEGGGQPADTGFLDDSRVLDVHEINGEAVHLCDKPLKKGSRVKGTIDWEKRFDNMQHHSAEHIVSGLVHKHFGFDNVGFHMGNVVTADFNGELSNEQVMAIEREANEIVYKNYDINVQYPSAEKLKCMDYRSKKELTGDVRIVTVPCADICACCGTHVKSTGEIGVIKLSAPAKYKGGVRLEILSGRKALLDYERKTEINLKLSQLFSAKPMEVFEAAQSRINEIEQLKLKIKELQSEIFEGIAEGCKNEDTPLFLSKQLDANELRELCLALIKKREGVVMVVSPSQKGPSRFSLAAKSEDLRSAGENMLKELNGRGGGSPNMIQGVIGSSVKEAESLFKKTFQKQVFTEDVNLK